jgi:hypothetical protein
MSNSSRALEYRLIIGEILAEDAALRAQGLPGLDTKEIAEIRDMLARTERRMLANVKEESGQVA